MIGRLSLHDFRNYSGLDWNCGAPLNILVGGNGQGKTSLLEALFFAGMLRSFRTARISEIERLGGDGFYVGAAVGEDQLKLEVEYRGGRRALRRDGVPVAKASDFIGACFPVAFSPEDIGMVAGASAGRRRWFDMFLSCVEPGYMALLNDYLKAMRSRNACLRSSGDGRLLSILEEEMAIKGGKIAALRGRYVEATAEKTAGILAGIKKYPAAFAIRHRCQAEIFDIEHFAAKLKSSRERDNIRGGAAIGPHIDDFEMSYAGRSLRSYGSTGQCRAVALCLKMAQISIMTGKFGGNGRITALVDDVTGDLDAATCGAFLELISGMEQVFFTFTETPENNFFKSAVIHRIDNGKLLT